MIHVVLGSQFGDEGKGKFTDILCSSAQLCCRAQGGNNAGHTIVHGEHKFDVHILPSGIVSPSCVNLIGAGCVVHVPSFFNEIEAVERKGVSTSGRIFVSDRAHIVLDLHQLVDGLEEHRLGKNSIGTTRKGIGPTYSAKMGRCGIRISDLLHSPTTTFEEKMRRLAYNSKNQFGDMLQYDVDDELSRLKAFRERLRPYVVDQIPLLKDSIDKNQEILIEGANAIMLDIDYGTYPFCTSSSTGIAGVFTGLAVNPRLVRDIFGVVKAYTTRVGSGPFPTEQSNEFGDKLQNIGCEFGATTGRKRRCGWLDLFLLKHSHAVNHYSSLNLTKLDTLDSFAEIKVGVAYSYEGQLLTSFPTNPDVLAGVEVHYEIFPGWLSDTKGETRFENLPENARKYVEFIEAFIGVRVLWIGTGPERESMILR